MKISIIITTLGQRCSLFEAIDSAVKQTYSNKEIIIINDGPDNGLRRKITREYPDLIYFCDGVNRGGNGARKKGVEIATGGYISFLDDDDLLLPEKLTLLSKEINGTVSSNVISGLTIRRCGNDFLLKPSSRKNKYSLSDVKYFHTGSSIIQREYILREELLPDLPKYQDTYFYSLSILKDAVTLIREPVCIWRREINHQGITTLSTLGDYKRSLIAFRKMQYLILQNSDLGLKYRIYFFWLLFKHSISVRKLFY